jgi:hypothetical protein
VRDLVSRFSEVERRVSALVAENRVLRSRVRELERERQAVGEQVRDAGILRDRSEQVRDRLYKLLALLDSIERDVPKTDRDAAGAEHDG